METHQWMGRKDPIEREKGNSYQSSASGYSNIYYELFPASELFDHFY